MKVWLAHHAAAFRLALRRLTAAPVNSLLSLLAVGVALALPAGGQMLLANALHLAGTTSAVPQISIFMASNAERKAAAEIESRLGRYGGVKNVQFLPREETLARMKANTGLRDVIEVLPGNPFPDAFVVTATDDRPEAMEKLAVEFRRWPKVEHVQLDSAWVRRLDALLKLGRTAVALLGVLLGAGLIAISFSIIRMQVLTHRAEIEVSQLLGATDGFIQRPFLYYGVLLGLGGGIVAWLLVGAAALWLRAPLGELVRLYDLTLVLQALDVRDSALLLGFAAGLGWLGAMISLRQHLKQS
ncbi:MAG: permease-like cell division protein FtsX [Sulfuritalea sp.]|jgi:cell division transport system permease protein|nr:permease-like cell division protein FtsX [Sulfuritalea sp.]